MDAHGIPVSGTERVRGIVQGLREIVQEEAEQRGREGLEEGAGGSADKKGEDGVGRVEDGDGVEGDGRKVPNFINAYKPDSDLKAECREWDLWDWRVEVSPSLPILLFSPLILPLLSSPSYPPPPILPLPFPPTIHPHSLIATHPN